MSSNFKPVGDEKEGYIYVVPPLSEVMGRCELCGKEDELRPYGPNQEKICFDCAMKDRETTQKQFMKQNFGEMNGLDH